MRLKSDGIGCCVCWSWTDRRLVRKVRKVAVVAIAHVVAAPLGHGVRCIPDAADSLLLSAAKALRRARLPNLLNLFAEVHPDFCLVSGFVRHGCDGIGP